MATVRNPSVAGYFYEGDREGLLKRLEWCFLHKLGPGKLPKLVEEGPRKVLGIVSPHAGYIYSGPIAAHGYYYLASDGAPDLVVMIGPNHHGIGAPISVYPEGVWRTPLGEVEVDAEVAENVAEAAKGLIELDREAHLLEHSLEVQLPFLQYIYGKKFRILPITMLSQNVYACEELGEALINSLSGRNFVIIASSDFTHYESYEKARRKDKLAIDAILSLEHRKLYETVVTHDITMCGYGPVMVLMYVAWKLDGFKAKVLKYATSGDISGNKATVVGYASIVFERT